MPRATGNAATSPTSPPARNAQSVLLDSADGEINRRLARQARSWGVELSA